MKETIKDKARVAYANTPNAEDIANNLHTSKGYIARAADNVPYMDLFTNSAKQGPYETAFKDVLRFSNVEAAKKSIETINALYNQYDGAENPLGKHQAQIEALLGANRAAAMGKKDEAKLFTEWLISSLKDKV